ncbi:hypothetical protein [Blastococcus sp. SYSU D00813]
MNRALRAATMGVLLLTPVALTACSAGQVNQTASQDRDKVGPSAQIGDLELRQVQLANPCEAGDEEATAYESGDDPELVLSIVNGSREEDTLTGVSGDVFDGVYVDELPGETSPTPTAAPTTSAAPSASAEPEAGTTETPGTTDTPTTTETPSGSEAPETGAAPTSAAPTTSAAPSASTSVDIPLPAGAVTTIGLRQYDAEQPCEPEVDADTTRLFLADLDVDAPLTASQTVTVTLTFQNAGEVTVQALVAGPGGELPRGEAFDFHEEEGADGGDEQDTEAE